MALKFLLSFCLMIGGSLANQFRIYNNCPFDVWPGIQGYAGYPHLENGGFLLKSYDRRDINTPVDWSGKIWGRTQCDIAGRCVTGDNGTPVSFAAIKLQSAADGLDVYLISLIDGYNLPMEIKPIDGFRLTSMNRYDCRAAKCDMTIGNIMTQCPLNLAVTNYGLPVACKNPGPASYPVLFKTVCPDAYAHAHDTASSTFLCRAYPHANYQITFCP